MEERIFGLVISVFCMFMGGLVVYLLMCAKTVIEDTITAIIELLGKKDRDSQ